MLDFSLAAAIVSEVDYLGFDLNKNFLPAHNLISKSLYPLQNHFSDYTSPHNSKFVSRSGELWNIKGGRATNWRTNGQSVGAKLTYFSQSIHDNFYYYLQYLAI